MTSEFIVAVHALVFLNHREKSTTSEEIAENVCTNPARVRKIMAKLKKAGLIKTKEGAVYGGYVFCKKAEQTNLLQVFNAVDEKIVSASWKSGSPDMECLIASGMAEIMDLILSKMDDSCKEILKGITIADINSRIFEKKKCNEKI